MQGDKKEGSTGPSEIVSCTNCGPSPGTHPANNGCVTEVSNSECSARCPRHEEYRRAAGSFRLCSVFQVRKREPPHPIRVAKTIDVIARITFPAAYAVFLAFFFYYYPDPGSGA